MADQQVSKFATLADLAALTDAELRALGKGKDRDRLTKDFVAGWAATPQVVVIERGEVVMNERIGMQHFERCAQFLNPSDKGTGEHARRFHA